jgi:hypothetical protein
MTLFVEKNSRFPIIGQNLNERYPKDSKFPNPEENVGPKDSKSHHFSFYSF